jgi:membrane-associated PAP2 superfamily phosphatase
VRAQRQWRSEAIILIALAVVATLLFAVTPLDIIAQRPFYRPQSPDHWPLAAQWPWPTLYRLAPAITAALLILGLLGLLIGQLRSRREWRLCGSFLILCVVIGPGLLVNVVFKDHWDRPRPRDVAALGGTLPYTPAPLRGAGGGSFPCGHCSVGFLYASGWWLWKQRRPAWARASLALGLALGALLGAGRMAAGAHFLSDVIWSALLALAVAHVLYHHVLRLAAPAASRPRAASVRMLPMLAVAGAALVLVALFVTPHGGPFAARVDLSRLSPPPRVLRISAASANIAIIIDDFPAAQMLVDGELHGFGLPASRLQPVADFQAQPVPTLNYRIEQRGWITDLDASATIRVPPGELQRLVVRLQRGDIRVTDTSAAQVVDSGALQLDLQTLAGHVQRLAR